MKNEDSLPIEPELEARIVAWVLGEASPFEEAELSRRVAADPALVVFKRRIEAVHGLVGEAVRPPQPALRLSAERRAKVLATLGADPGVPPLPLRVMAMPVLRHRKWWQMPVWISMAAAGLMTALFVGYAVYQTRTLSIAKSSSHGFLLKNPDGGEQSFIARLLDRGREERIAKLEKMVRWETQKKLEYEAGQRKKAIDEALAATEKRKKERAEREAVSVNLPIVAPSGSGGPDRIFPESLPDTPIPAPSILEPPSPTADMAVSGRMAPPLASATFKGNRLAMSDAAQPAHPVTFNSLPSTVTVGGALSAPGDISLSVPSANTAADAGYYISERPRGGKGAMQSFGAVVLGNNKQIGEASPGAGSSNALSNTPKDEQMWGQATAGSLMANASDQTVELSPFSVDKLAGDGVGGVSASQTQGREPSTRRANSDISFSYGGKVQTVAGGLMRDSGRLGITGSLEAAKVPSPALNYDAPVAHPPVAVDPSLRAEVTTDEQPISTFSLQVSDASFRLAQTALAKGERPDPASIRPEEFYNAFDYGDPAPTAGEPVACRIEQAAHPFLQQRNIVRIAMKVPATGRGAGQSLRLTVLLDTSGSMEREDRVATVRRAMAVLASLLGPADRVTLIGFARQPRLLADRVAGDQVGKLLDVIARTPAEGGTNLEEALKLAGEKATAQFDAAAQNRIVVLSDGAANLGADDPNRLSTQVAALRQQGISFDACGVGAEGLDDSILEALTRKGDGRYYVLNSAEDADAGFAAKLAGAFRPAAENVKVQVRFNPARVQAYRLIGFEKHRLRTEDFRNDRVTAAELAAEESAVALYQVQVKPEGDGELGDVFVRFKNPATGETVERSWTLMYTAQPEAFDRATPSLQLATSAALLAEKLRGGALADQIHLGELGPVMNRLRGEYGSDRRVQDFFQMFVQSRRLFGE